MDHQRKSFTASTGEELFIDFDGRWMRVTPDGTQTVTFAEVMVSVDDDQIPLIIEALDWRVGSAANHLRAAVMRGDVFTAERYIGCLRVVCHDIERMR